MHGEVILPRCRDLTLVKQRHRVLVKDVAVGRFLNMHAACSYTGLTVNTRASRALAVFIRICTFDTTYVTDDPGTRIAETVL